jgi:hypothetical protein
VRVVVVAAVIVDAITIDADVTITMAGRARAVDREIISVGVLALLRHLSCLSGQSRSVSKLSGPIAMRCWQASPRNNGR